MIQALVQLCERVQAANPWWLLVPHALAVVGIACAVAKQLRGAGKPAPAQAGELARHEDQEAE